MNSLLEIVLIVLLPVFSIAQVNPLYLEPTKKQADSLRVVLQPTDINSLANEYLRLAYHGLRAKDKSFNATLKTEYEDGLEKVDVIPQDIGRMVLNLITNAFM